MALMSSLVLFIKAVPLHTMEALGGRGVQLLRFLNFGTRRG
jgi:hypothetical protein